MKKAPTISVLMPIYNCEKYLGEAINSVLEQTYKDFEFIIVNDGSTDGTSKILSIYAKSDSRIKIVDQINSGIVVALNRGLSEAKGDWVFRMDGDDVALPTRFEAQVAAIKNNPSLVLLGGWCQMINQDGIPLKIHKYRQKHHELVHCLESSKAFFPHASACFPRKTVLEIGAYRERFRHSEDTDLWLRLSEIGEIACINEVVLKLRKHPDNISNLSSGQVQLIRSLAARICYLYRKRGLPDPSNMDDNTWNSFLFALEQHIQRSGYFDTMNGRQKLHARWMASPNRTQKILNLLHELLVNANARGYFFHRIRNKNIVKQMITDINQTTITH